MTNYEAARWRLIRSGPAAGATNMAIDEAILRAVATGDAPPTLRFYAWDPPCLSLGRSQPVSDVDPQALQAAEYDLIRRPTGGRAILHIDELTYSIIAREGDPRVAGGVVESYRRISRALVRGLERLGLAGIVADQRIENHRQEGPVCFEMPSDYEITVGGRKLVGSAQMRAQGVVLQHGALPLYGDIARLCPLLSSHPDPGGVRARAVALDEVLGRAVTWDEAANALATGFAGALNLALDPGTLTPGEQAQTRVLRTDKYATDRWTSLL
jgi:lipoate-protein ligase A